MTPQQTKTAKLAGLGCLLPVLFVMYLLVVEALGVKSGGGGSISEVLWIVWSAQAWVVWLISVLLAFIAGFFGGHFFGQSSVVYERAREGKP